MAQDVADDVCDSWEDMIENGILEKKLEELQLKLPRINNSTSEQSLPPPFYPQMKLEDPSRTPYAPQVKILKRPSASDKGAAVVGAEKSPSRQPPKTLQQREAEYAEARLRILGSRHSEEEQSPSGVTSSPLAASERQQAEVVVTRLPRGPDGTNGFSQPR